VTVRTYREGDLSSIIELYDEACPDSPHFTRSAAFLEHYMNYPDVDKDGAFLAQVDGEITGLAIVSVTREQGGLTQGNIIELQTKDAVSMQLLIEAVLDYCRKKDVDTIVVVPPLIEGSEGILEGWLKFDTGVMMGKALCLPSLIHALLSTDEIKTSFAGKRVVFRVGDQTIDAEMTTEGINVADSARKSNGAAAEIIVSPHVFLEIVLGKLNPYVAGLTGRVRVKALGNTVSMLRLLHMMRIEEPFHTSLADRM
jgi:putative sterol carrier protein